MSQNRPHWHVGMNIPGYLPESDVYRVETKRDAIALLRQEKEDVLDSEYEIEDPAERRTVRGNARRDLGYYFHRKGDPYDLGLSLWAEECYETECEIDSEESHL